MATQAQLVVTIDEAGKISVTGPINDPILAYGMLECARDAIKDFNDQQAKRIIPGSPHELSLVGVQ
jgi:hypothetical protein